jgi:hypothetical protein
MSDALSDPEASLSCFLNRQFSRMHFKILKESGLTARYAITWHCQTWDRPFHEIVMSCRLCLYLCPGLSLCLPGRHRVDDRLSSSGPCSNSYERMLMSLSR